MTLLIGKKAPAFEAQAVIHKEIQEHFSLSQYEGSKYVFLFFYPLDFTFVCPTEIHAFQDHLEEFNKRETQIVGCSIDSPYSHLAWLNTPRRRGGIEGTEYPLISDLNKTISKDFDVLSPEGIAYRGLFLIDRQGIIRHQLVNDLGIGRSITESLRILDALRHYETYGEVCPANWESGKQALKATQASLESYLKTH